MCDGVVYTPERTRAYEALVRSICSLRLPPGWATAGRFYVDLMFYVRTLRGDVDNMVKSVLDGMNRIAYVDDKQVQRLVAERIVDMQRPRAEITVRRVVE